MSVAYRSTCGPTLCQCVDRDVTVNIATDISVEISADMLVDRHILIDTSVENRSICRPTYRSSIGRDVDRHIGQDVDRHIG